LFFKLLLFSLQFIKYEQKKIPLVAASLSMLILLNSCGYVFGGSRYEGTITAKTIKCRNLCRWSKKMGMGQVTATFPNKALNVEVKRMAAMQSTNFIQHLEQVSF
jgi:hypothetical protein